MFCPACGSQNVPEASRCSHCGAALPTPQPAAAPAAPVTAPVATISSDVYVGSYRLAGLGDRFLALLLDAIFLGALFWLIFVWAAVRWGATTETGFNIQGPRALVPMGLALAAGFLYCWLGEGLLGATLGKAVLGIQVRRKDASSCTLAASLVRNLARIIDYLPVVYLLGFFVALFSRLRQRIGDHLAGTVVVQRDWGKVLRGAVALVWVVAIGGCVWYAYVIHRNAPTAVAGEAGGGVTAVSGAGSADTFTSGGYRLVNFSYRESKEGPVRAAGPYKPNDQVFASYELRGASLAQNQVNLDFNITLLDPSGLPVETVTMGLKQAVDPNAPIQGNFRFPLRPYYPAGTYKIAIKVHDGVSNRDAQFYPSFVLEAPAIAPASQLEVREFQFAASQDGPGLSSAAYQAGQTVYYRFQVFGLQFREDKANLHIAFKLLGPGGDALIDKPDWDTTQDTFPYHPATFHLPYHGYISLPSDAAKGIFTQQYVITDNVAGKSLTYEAKFEVK